jgi:hypothetical protein
MDTGLKIPAVHRNSRYNEHRTEDSSSSYSHYTATICLCTGSAAVSPTFSVIQNLTLSLLIPSKWKCTMWHRERSAFQAALRTHT